MTIQCDYCAFKISENQSDIEQAALIEEKYKTLRQLKKAPKQTRNIYIGGKNDKSETCFINSPTWGNRNENIYCSDFIDSELSLETALDLREARLANKRADEANTIARDAKIWAIIATIIAIIAIIFPIIKNL